MNSKPNLYSICKKWQGGKKPGKRVFLRLSNFFYETVFPNSRDHELQNTFVFIIPGGGTNKHINSGRFRQFVNDSLFSNSVVISRRERCQHIDLPSKDKCSDKQLIPASLKSDDNNYYSETLPLIRTQMKDTFLKERKLMIRIQMMKKVQISSGRKKFLK